MHDVRFIGAEYTDRAVFFIAAQALGVRVMALEFTGFIVIAQNALHVFKRHLLFRLGVDREGTAFLHRLLQARRQDLLNLPNARVVVDAVTGIVAGVGLGEIKCAVFLRIVETVVRSPLD